MHYLYRKLYRLILLYVWIGAYEGLLVFLLKSSDNRCVADEVDNEPSRVDKDGIIRVELVAMLTSDRHPVIGPVTDLNR